MTLAGPLGLVARGHQVYQRLIGLISRHYIDLLPGNSKVKRHGKPLSQAHGTGMHKATSFTPHVHGVCHRLGLREVAPKART